MERHTLNKHEIRWGFIDSVEFDRAGWGKGHPITAVKITYAEDEDEEREYTYLEHNKGGYHLQDDTTTKRKLKLPRLCGLTDAFRYLPVGTEIELTADPETNIVYIKELPPSTKELPPSTSEKSCAQKAEEVRKMLAAVQQSGGHHV